MIYKAYSVDTNKFLSLPETGMGYQVIEAKRSSETIKKKFIVYNSELIVDLDSRFPEFLRQIKTASFSKVLNEAESWLCETSSISLVSKATLLERRILGENREKYKHRHPDGKGAKDNPKENANGIEIFVRLSPYENDRRVDLKRKRLTKGSYTTTYADYKDCVKYSDDPIDRYALPSDEEIKWSFYIQPYKIDELQRGIVQPAFGHYGGGIEAFFENGTSDNTYLKTESYGK